MFMRRNRQSALRRLRIEFLPLPVQALGLAVLVAVLATALVSAPLMIASAEDGTWKQERARLNETTVGATLVSSSIAGRQQSSPDRIIRAADLDDAVAAAAERAGLTPPVFMSELRDPLVVPTGTSVELAQLIHRTGAEDHVEITAGSWSEDGFLVPQDLAEEAGVAPGDVLEVWSESGRRTAELPVSGIYADPPTPMPAYWEAHGYLFLPWTDPVSGDLKYPPMAIFAPEELGLSTVSGLYEDLFLYWFLPAEPGIGVEDARATAADFERLQAVMADPDSPVSHLVTEEGYQRPTPLTALPAVLDTVDRTTALLAPPVRAVGIGGAAAALVLVGAWAGQRMRRREDELRSLVARGLSPARAAWDVVRECLLPVAAGLAAGGLAGWLIVRELGPSEHLPPGTLTSALIVLAVGGLAVLAVVAAVTAVLVTRLDQVGTGQAAHLLGRIPWLAVTAAVAVLATVPLVTGGPEAGGRVGVLTLMVPLLVTVVVAGVVTGLLPHIGRRADAWLRRLRPGAFLAVRRVLAGHGTARLVVVTTALSLGLVVYAGALADGTDRTIEAKASVAAGSDLVVPLAPTSSAAGALPAGAMVVSRDKDTTLLPGDTDANVLVVHPDEVAGVVHWNDELAEQPLDELMGALRDYRGDRVPVVLAGGPSAGVTAAAGDELTVDFGYYSMPVEVVARADAFPGQASLRPLVVADWDRYVAALENANRDPELLMSREVWVRGEANEALDRLEAAGYAPRSFDDVDTRAEFAARPELKAQTWALAYLRAVALAAGVLGLVGVAMHAMAQQRRRTVAALLLARMGMTRRASDASVGLEIALLTGLAAVVAVAVAIPASALVLKLLDPVPSLRPEAVFATPWTSIAAVLGGAAVVTAASAVLVGRSARRVTGGQVMRDAS